MMCKERLENYLREHGVPCEVHHHPRVYTAQEVAASEHIAGEMMVKVVMVVASGKPIMLVVPAPERVYLPELAHVLGTKELRLAEEREFAHIFPDCELGAMPPLGNLYNVPVYVDNVLAAEETIYFQAGTHTDTISMKYTDFERLAGPTVASFTLDATLV